MRVPRAEKYPGPPGILGEGVAWRTLKGDLGPGKAEEAVRGRD